LALTAAALVGKSNSQYLASIAWAYAVANVAYEFTSEDLTQLYQWHL